MIGLVLLLARRISGVVVQERHDTAPRRSARAARSPDTAHPTRRGTRRTRPALPARTGAVYTGLRDFPIVSRCCRAVYRKVLPNRVHDALGRVRWFV